MARWKRRVALVILGTHLRRQLSRGAEGVVAIVSYAYLSLRICVGALRQALLAAVGRQRGRGGEKESPPVAESG